MRRRQAAACLSGWSPRGATRRTTTCTRTLKTPRVFRGGEKQGWSHKSEKYRPRRIASAARPHLSRTRERSEGRKTSATCRSLHVAESTQPLAILRADNSRRFFRRTAARLPKWQRPPRYPCREAKAGYRSGASAFPRGSWLHLKLANSIYIAHQVDKPQPCGDKLEY